MKNKYVVWCNQRHIYYGGESDVRDTEHFNSLNDIKEMLIDYHHDIEEQDHKLLYKMGAVEIADLFDWSIENIRRIDDK